VTGQRLRVRFGRGEEVKHISHLDVMRFWERALRRAGLEVAYSEGFTPRPRLALAAPLPVGVTSEAELLDVYLAEAVAPAEARERLAAATTPGFTVLGVDAVLASLPALQADLRWAEYRVVLEEDLAPARLQADIDAFLAKETFPWEHRRDRDVRRYDLRALVSDLWLEAAGEGLTAIGMRLRADSSGSGRPEQVTAALGWGEPASIHRTRLILEGLGPVIQAWRRAGRFQD
jgi:radical SAM-linked protein